jgi:hypothetical protein
MSHKPSTASLRLPFPTFAVIFGVIGPLLLLAHELDKRNCGLNLFDPLTSLWHVLLVLCVPVGTLLTLVATRHRPAWLRAAAWMNGVATVVAACYMLWFVAMVPYGREMTVSLIFATLLLMLALLASLRCRTYLQPHKSEVAGMAVCMLVGVLLFLAAESPILITQGALRMTAGAEELHVYGLRVLDSVGDERTMLHLCRGHARYLGFFGGVLQSVLPVTPAQARRAYADVTGLDYYEMPETIFPNHELFGNAGN